MRAIDQLPDRVSVDAVAEAWSHALEQHLEAGIPEHLAWRRRRAAGRPMPLTTALFRDGSRLACDYLLLPGTRPSARSRVARPIS